MTLVRENWVLVLLLAATVLVLVLLAIVVSAALRGGGADGREGAARTLRLLGTESLRLSFRRAVKLIEANLASGAERYNLAWTLLLNDSSEADVPLAQAGLRSALSEHPGVAGQQGIAWHFFDQGIVVQMRTHSLGADDGDRTWDTFLGLCRNYRPQRPFDAIVLAVPCLALLDLEPAGQLALVARAQALHRRLWLAQNRLALRFPVHLVITECERIPGFARFGAAVPEPLRRAILGWASPYELVAPYRDQWADSALDQVTGAVADTCAELCALEDGGADSSAYLLLPAELERLRAGLKTLCDELMRPSAYHESFLLRGVYLTGDSSPAALLQAPLAGAGGADVTPAAPDSAIVRMPVFLRDIFERKVFAEVGLVRASRQRLRQPAARRLGFWLALLVPLAWGVGIGVGTYGLSQKKEVLLKWLKSDGGGAAAPGVAPNAHSAVLRQQEANQIAALRFYALAIPGSWSAFSAIDAQVRARLDSNFASLAVSDLREAALARLNQLTGVDYKLEGNRVTGGGACVAPAVAPAQAGIDLGRMPEYAAMKSYLDGLDQLDQGLGAMRRLRARDGKAASGQDLARALNLLLNYDVPPTFDNAAALYRDAVRRAPDIPESFMHDAAACAMTALAGKMYRHLFENNPLLVAELAVNDAYRRLRLPESHDAGAGRTAWADLQQSLEAEQSLLAKGGGLWMAPGASALGRTQDELLIRIRANGMLGEPAAADLAESAARGLAGFRSRWNDALAGSGEDGSAGLVWDDNNWRFTPVRKKLADSVKALFVPAYMQPAPVRALPAPQQGRTVHWDKTQLDNANALIEARRTFLAGPYTTFPLSLQSSAAGLVDALLVVAIQNTLAQAAALGDPGLPSAAGDAERTSVLAIRNWLHDIKADALAGQIDALLAGDALVRLQRLDAVLAAAQLYMPPDPNFSQWQGQKGVMADAYADGDPEGLHVYLQQQSEFIDAIGTQAEGVLNVLASVTPPGAKGPAPALVARWQALGTDLVRYRQKSPASSRLALETFIRTGSANLDVTNCAATLGMHPGARRATDLFSERLTALQQGVLARCRALAGSAGQSQWRQFADAWNRDLGQRAPFSAARPGQPSVPADREAVRAVLKLYESAQDAGKLAGMAPYAADAQLRRVHDLLAPLFPVDAAKAGALDVAVVFRDNRGAERGANQIIDWTLTVGPKTLRLADAPAPLPWTPGMPVSLALRFAQDGGSMPVADPARPGMTVAGRTVTFSFTDPWALLTFINAYRDSGAPGDDARGQLLRLAFGLAPAAGIPGAADGEARVFVRLQVSAPGTFKPLAWPVAIPRRLPLTRETGNNSL